MKQLLFELRKISLSKLTVVIVLVLLLVTGGLAYNQASKTPESQQTRQYEKKISAVISNAKRQLQQSLYNSEDSYATLYFEDVIEIYTDLKDLELAEQPVNGWDTYLSFSAANPLLLICAVFLSVHLFSIDSKTGMQPILYASANGRLQYAAAKIGATLLSAFVLNLLFFGITLLGMWLGTLHGEAPAEPMMAFAGLGEYVQSFGVFLGAPYALRTWQAILLLFAVRTCITVFVCSLAGLLTYALGNRLVALVLSMLVYVANIVLNNRTYLNTDVFFDHCNLVAASDAATFLSKYQCVRVLGKPVSVVLAILVLYAALALVCLGGFVLLHLKFANVKLGSKEKRKHKSYASASSRSALLGWELKKLTKSRVVMLTLILLLLASAVGGVLQYREYTSKSDQIYYDYVQVLAPMDDAQRWGYLDAESERVSQGYRNYFKYRNATPDALPEGIDMLQIENEYYYACLHEMPLVRVSEACAYQSERGLDGLTLLYDTGWMTLFESGDHILLFLAILIVATSLAAVEFSSKFAGILSTTPRGRRDTWRTKLLLSALLTTAFFTIFTLMQLLPILLAYRFEDANAALISLQTYKNALPSITLWQYAAMILLLRYASCLFICVLTCYVTSQVKVSYLSLLILTAAVQLPGLLYGMGADVLQHCRMTTLLDGNAFYICLMDQGWLRACATGALFVLVCAVLGVIHQRKNKEAA
ncbi:MAG: hypothetical protein IJW70_08425 [Clostridia bacterium]|nr:hypothetical protein [Clostridia bacterium]